MNDIPLWLLGSTLGALLLTSAFFSGSETAMMSLNRYRLKHLKKKHRGARRVSKLLNRVDRLIGIILIGNNLANNFAAIIAAVIAVRLFGAGSELWAGVLLTIVMLIFAEITPKTISALYPERIAFPSSYLLKPLLKLLYPAVWLVNHFSNALVKLMGFNPETASDDRLSKEELRTVVDESSEDMADHQDMLINVLDLGSVTVNDIMVPRNEIQGLDLDQDITVLADQIIRSDYTRLPVYHGDINSVIGFLHMKKVARLLRGGAETLTKEAIKRFSREPYFIPEETPLNRQLLNFQHSKRRIGLVVDEYGEIEGLVTLDDILEEIVGDYTTNEAESSEEIVHQKDGSYLIDCTATIRDINKITHWSLPMSGPKTLNGLALEQLEHFPEGNVSFVIDNYRFETVSLGENMLDKILVRKTGEPQRQLELEEI